MKRFKFRGNYHKLIDGFEVNESSREVKYSNVKIDFTKKGIQDLPLKYEECQLVDADVEEKQASEGETIEGSSFSIDYDSDRNFEYNLKGQTTQTGTPTPSSPQPINITTGRQEINVCEKNLFDGIFRQGSESSTTPSNYVFSSSNLQLNAGTYTFSTTLDGNYQYAIFGTTIPFPNSSTKTYNSGWKTGNLTFTISQTLYVGVLIRKGNSSNFTPSDISSFNFQLEKGSSSTTYEEYKGNDYEINLGKNLLQLTNGTYSSNGVEAVVSDGIITLNGTATSNSFITIPSNIGNIYNSLSGNYTLCSNNEQTVGSTTTSGTYADVRIMGNNGVDFIWRNILGNQNASQTSTPLAYNNISLMIRTGSGIVYDNFILKPQLEKGNVASSFSPYKTPIYLGEIGNYKDYIKKSSGKNLLENTITTQTINGITFTHNDDGSITINGTASGGTAYIDFYNKDNELLVKDTTKTYTFSIGATNSNIELLIGERNVGSEIIDVIADGYVSSLSYTPTGRYTGQVFRLGVRNTATINNLTIYPQIEEGELSDYEPYGTGQWYIHKEIGRYDFTGTENFSASQWGTNSWDLFNIIATTWNTNELQIMSNLFKGIPHANRGTGGNNIIYTISNNSFEIRNTSYSTLTDIRNATKGSYIYWILQTPTNTLIEDEELINQLNSIELLNGLNNITITSSNLPFIMNLHYNFNDYIEIVDEKEIIYTGYVNNYTLPKMKNKLEYRELDIDLLSPLALATLRTADAIGTYNLQPLIREIIQPLIDDGFKLKELNIGNNEISVNYLTETIESALNKLSNKFNFWWYIDKNKNIYINDINYIFNKNKVLTYDNDNSINGLIDFTPSMESIDYCNTIDFTNVRLITKSHFQKDINIIDDITNVDYLYYNPLISKDYINPGEEIEFDIPFIIDTNRRGYSSTGPNVEQGYFRLYENVNDALSELVSLRYDENNKVIIPNNASIGDSYNEDKEFVFVRDSFFKNLIVGMKYNGSTQIDVGLIVSDTALMWSKIRINNNEEIERNQNIISTSGIIEKQIDMNEQWLTFEELLEISNSLIGNNNVNVEKVNLVMDIENNLNVGDIISINKSSFLTYGEFIITDKKRSYYDNVDTWTYTLNNTNILESYVDLFRSREEEEQNEKVFNLISSDYSKEGFVEKYDVGVESLEV